MQKKTSKVKSIWKITKWTNPQNQKDIFYHNLEMENGDKISLGKITEWAFTVGQEITYIEEEWRDGRKKWKEERKFTPKGWGITDKQVAFLGACIIKAHNPNSELSVIIAELKKEVERCS